MELPWKEYLRLYFPFVALLAVNALGAIYAYGYKRGMDAMREAAYASAMEAKNG